MSEQISSFDQLYGDLMGSNDKSAEESLAMLRQAERVIVDRLQRIKRLADSLYAQCLDDETRELATAVYELGLDLDATYGTGVTAG